MTVIHPSHQLEGLSQRQLSWLAAALDDRDANGARLDPAAEDVITRYIQLSGDDGESNASNAELVAGLAPRRHGRRAHRRTVGGRKGARPRIERRGLIACDRTVLPKRHSRTEAWMVSPWCVRIVADSEHVRPFAWAEVGVWLAMVLADASLTTHERTVARRLARVFDANGTLDATRDDLEKHLGLFRRTVVNALRTLEERGHVSLDETREKRPVGRPVTVFSIVARTNAAAGSNATSTEEEAVVETRAAAAAPDPAVSVPAPAAVLATPIIDEEEGGQLVVLTAAHADEATTPRDGDAVVPNVGDETIPVMAVADVQAEGRAERAKRTPGRTGSRPADTPSRAHAMRLLDEIMAPPRHAPKSVSAELPSVRASASDMAEPTFTSATLAAEPAPAETHSPAAPALAVIKIRIETDQFNPEWLARLRAICSEFPGEVPIWLVIPDGREVPLKTRPGGEPVLVGPTKRFKAAVEALKRLTPETRVASVEPAAA